MTTDRELLEAAAKAAGIVGEWSDERNGLEIAVPWRNLTNYETWNPLLDDGDAFRLAVKLCMQVECSRGWQHVSVYGRDFRCSEQHDGRDPEAATRRAIVRAAAALGEQG